MCVFDCMRMIVCLIRIVNAVVCFASSYCYRGWRSHTKVGSHPYFPAQRFRNEDCKWRIGPEPDVEKDRPFSACLLKMYEREASSIYIVNIHR